MNFLSILIAILLAAVAYAICALIGLPMIVSAVAAILVLLSYFPLNNIDYRR